MAVRLRLKLAGRKGRAFFRLGAFDSRSQRDGRAIEELGYVDPFGKTPELTYVLKTDRIEYWLSKGAQPTETVAVLIKKLKTGKLYKPPAPPKPKKPKKAEEPPKTEGAAAPAEAPKAVTPAAEAAKPAEAPKAEAPKPAEAPKAPEAPKTAAPAPDAAKPAEAPKAEAPKAAEAPKPEGEKKE